LYEPDAVALHASRGYETPSSKVGDFGRGKKGRKRKYASTSYSGNRDIPVPNTQSVEIFQYIIFRQ
jgi:hypothetical protein